MTVATETPPTTLECERCGTPHAAGQEYCLECGARLPVTPPPAGRTAPPRTRPEWVWPVLVAGIVAVLATGAAVAARVSGEGESESFLVATTDTPTLPAPTDAGPPAEPAQTAPAEPEPETPAEEQPAPAPQEPEPERLISWPAGTDGFTVVLASIPEGNGRASATAKAREARDAGLRQVGVLDSSRYQSLHPGYFVVFSGVYADRGSAENAVSAARRAGYDAAYARQISS